METLFDNHKQALKVRMVLWASILVCAGALYGGWVIFQTYGLSPGDGGVLRPFGQRLGFGAFVALLGVAFAGGMMLFASLYVLRLVREGDQVIIDTLTPWGIGTRKYVYDLSEIGESAYYHGRMDRPVSTGSGMVLMQKVDAPWITLRTARRWFPLVLDLQAETIKKGALGRLAKGAVGDWEKDRP